MKDIQEQLGMDRAQTEKFLDSNGVLVIGKGKNLYAHSGEMEYLLMRRKDLKELANIDLSKCKKIRV